MRRAFALLPFALAACSPGDGSDEDARLNAAAAALDANSVDANAVAITQTDGTEP